MTTMQHFDLSPLYRASIGFDQVSDLMNRVITNNSTTASYPPYNIEKTADDSYRISIAVAGFSDADLNVEVKNNEILCNNIGLIQQVRTENTNASAFGNMTLTKNLMSFK